MHQPAIEDDQATPAAAQFAGIADTRSDFNFRQIETNTERR
jgi:hypothetical protein